MNSRTTLALLAVMAAAGTLAAVPAFAQEAMEDAMEDTMDAMESMEDAESTDAMEEHIGTYNPSDAEKLAAEILLDELPISVWTDKSEYDHAETIMVKGQVANAGAGFPVTITVVNELNSVITVAQLDVADDRTFSTELNTSGDLWKFDGSYYIRAGYGSTDDTVRVELTGGVEPILNFETPSDVSEECGEGDLEADGACIPFTITGGTVTGAHINTDDSSIVIGIESAEGGTLTVTPDREVQDGIFLVLVDGEEWDDAEIDGNMVTVMFPPGTEEIEVIGTFVIPEFGAIAALILAVAVVSVVALTARSRLGLMPRY